MSSNKDDDLKEHDIIQKIKKSGYDISNLSLTHIKGYVADSPIKDCVRLFTTLNFNICVDIPKDKIIHIEEVSKDKMEFGGTCIWLPKNAEITYTKIERSKIEAQFLEGNIMQDYLAFAKGLDFQNARQLQFHGLITPITTLPCIIATTIIIDTIIIITLSKYCPSVGMSCISQCEACPA